MSSPVSITYNGSATPPTPPSTNMSNLALTPDLSLPQMTVRVTTPNSDNVDVAVLQYSLKLSTLTNIPNYIPPGTWDLNIYARANVNSDVEHIGLQFYLLGINTQTSTYTNLGASTLTYLYDHVNIQPIVCTLFIQNVIDLTPYDNLSILITARNLNANNHTAFIYFQTFNTYSHIHTSFAASLKEKIGSALEMSVGKKSPISLWALSGLSER